MGNTYNISLDIGTNSVGWSVDDDNFKLHKFRKKNMWGSVLFDNGNTAKNRRVSRNSRRRINRRKKRIIFLQNMLAPMVLAKDDAFFLRLKESFLHNEDRCLTNTKGNLFVNTGMNEKEYYKKFPTIYHLRKYLMESDEKVDERLVYLAIHHIIKYRGNFLHEGKDFSEISSNINEEIDKLIKGLRDHCNVDLQIAVNKLKEVLKSNDKSKKKKVEDLLLLAQDKSYKAILTNVFKCMNGLSFEVNKIFEDDIEEKEVFKLSDDDAEEKLSILEDVLQEKFIIIEKCKLIYNWIQLSDVLSIDKFMLSNSNNDITSEENTSISSAMVNRYNKYKDDLKILKKFIIEKCDRSTYVKLFKEKDNGSYYLYEKNKDKSKNGKSESKIFYDNITKALGEYEIDDIYDKYRKYILTEIEKESFLKKINIKDNSAIPYQLNENELKIILAKQGKYYPILNEQADKIIKLLNFRIPYYVGPLTDKRDQSPFAWMVKNPGYEGEHIYPWNFEEVVNIHESAEKFITNMTNKCTYLPMEDVIPKYSLLYSDYMFYNEINKVRVAGDLLDSYFKEKIRCELFLRKNVVKESDIEAWAKKNLIKKGSITGLQGNKQALSTLKSYNDFTKILGAINEKNIPMIEKIIYWLTIFEDRKIVSEKIENEYIKKGLITKEQKDKILRLKYKGWSRLSKKLLVDITVQYKNNLKQSIIDTLRITNLNFMQIINTKKLGFSKKIKEINKKEVDIDISYNGLVKDIQGSPSIKKGIWQSLKIVDEIIRIMGCPPKSIFLEMARSNEDSKRSVPKIEKVKKLLSDSQSNIENKKDLLKEFKNIKDLNLRQYLYFIQHGKCMYSMESLDFDNLHQYEVDHILPQCYIKDDSIDNMVLVKKSLNQNKSGSLRPLDIVPIEKRNTIKYWWSILFENKFLSYKKYQNLKRETDFYENEKVNFINRQLVEQRQIAKHVVEILNSCYEKNNVNIVLVKAALVSELRELLEIPKIRELNDYHHARDAFLTSVIGSYMIKRYPKLEDEFYLKGYLKSAFKNKKWSFLLGEFINYYKNDEDAFEWNPQEKIPLIKKQINYKDVFINKKVEKMKGQMFKITMNPKLKNGKDAESKIPLKSKKDTNLGYLDVMKYGYYEGVESAYCTLVKYTIKKKEVMELVSVPIMIDSIIGKSKEKLIQYVKNKLNIEEVTILREKVYKYQKFEIDEGVFYLASASEWHNAKQLVLSEYDEKLLYKIITSKFNKNDNKDEILDYAYRTIIEKVMNNFVIFKDKMQKVLDQREKFESLEIDKKCELIRELIKLTKANGEYPALGLIGLSKERFGRIYKKSTRFSEIKFIDSSVTGLFFKKERF